MNVTRTYSSPLRQQQAEATRLAIVEAAFTLLAQSPDAEFSHERIASHARIATRTVYRHFPSREELLDAVWAEVDRQLDLSEYPDTEADLLDALPRVFKKLDERRPLISALLASNAAREMRRRNNERRRLAIHKALANATAHLSPAQKAQAVGIFQVLFSAPAWQMLRDRAHLTGDQSADAARWAMQTLLDALHKDNRRLHKHTPTTKGTRK